MLTKLMLQATYDDGRVVDVEVDIAVAKSLGIAARQGLAAQAVTKALKEGGGVLDAWQALDSDALAVAQLLSDRASNRLPGDKS